MALSRAEDLRNGRSWGETMAQSKAQAERSGHSCRETMVWFKARDIEVRESHTARWPPTVFSVLTGRQVPTPVL